MSKGLKIMLLATIGIPSLVTLVLFFIDFTVGKEIQFASYSPIFLGLAAGGLIFGGPLLYLISKSQENQR